MIYYLLFSFFESISNQRLPKNRNLRMIYKNLDILNSYKCEILLESFQNKVISMLTILEAWISTSCPTLRKGPALPGTRRHITRMTGSDCLDWWRSLTLVMVVIRVVTMDTCSWGPGHTWTWQWLKIIIIICMEHHFHQVTWISRQPVFVNRPSLCFLNVTW